MINVRGYQMSVNERNVDDFVDALNFFDGEAEPGVLFPPGQLSDYLT